MEGGVVSSFMHDTLKPGDTVDLSPPFGCFTPRASTSKAVLLSGGIGVTPFLLPFSPSLSHWATRWRLLRTWTLRQPPTRTQIALLPS